ncbi:MAG: alanine--glyoxylate aminotransferase family protein [Candidatus Latescibacteria bacterium]|nr:alanine--glyoxylate aminotransferase family protein [Candidatus Latescibacterota bacterium]
MRSRIFAPGPTPIPDEVQAAMAAPLVYHRGPDFPDFIRTVVAKLKPVFPTQDDVLLLASSGSGAMEAAVVNTLSQGDRALVIQAGQFGAKWTAICQAYGVDVDVLDLPWGSAVDSMQVAERLKAHPDTRVVFATHSETSTGVLHDVEALGRVVGETEALLVVDGVSSVIAHPLRTNDWGVDIAVTASQKGLGVPPGVGVVTVSARAWDAMQSATLPKFYLDLNAYRTALEEGRGPATLPMTLMAGMGAALDLVAAEGIENVWARHARHAEAVRQATVALGLSVFPDCPSNVLTAVALPEDVDGLAIMADLRARFGITVGGGLAHLRGHLIRISNLGFVDDLDILTVVSAFEMSLQKMGWSFTPGVGVAAVEKVLSE